MIGTSTVADRSPGEHRHRPRPMQVVAGGARRRRTVRRQVRHRHIQVAHRIELQHEHRPTRALQHRHVGHAHQRHTRHRAQRRRQQHDLRRPALERHGREHPPQRRNRTVGLAGEGDLQHPHAAERPAVGGIEVQRLLRHEPLTDRARPPDAQEIQPRPRPQHRLHGPLPALDVVLVAAQRRHRRRLLGGQIGRQRRPTTPTRPQHEQHQQHQHRHQQHQLQRRRALNAAPPRRPHTPPPRRPRAPTTPPPPPPPQNATTGDARAVTTTSSRGRNQRHRDRATG